MKMGRTIIVEELLEAKINSFFGSSKLHVGLLVGQFTDARDFVVHMAQAPDPVENEAEVENTEEEMMLQGETASEKRIIKKESKQKKSQTNEDFDESWVIEHARQIHKMLPGGLCVAGIYVFSAPEFMNKNQSKLRHCLHKIHKQLEKTKYMCLAIPHNERILLHICSASKKITCRTVDVKDTQGTLKPCELKYQQFLHKWHTLKCVGNVDVDVFIPQSVEKSNYEAQIQLSLQDHFEQIWDSIMLIDKEFIQESDYLFNPAKGSKAKKDEGKTFDVELFMPCVSASAELMRQKSIGVVSLHGKIISRAYVHNRATKGMVAKAVKMDLIRSIQSRVELLCDEAEVNYLYQAVLIKDYGKEHKALLIWTVLRAWSSYMNNWSLITPTRIFAPMPRGPIHFCDYAFKDERLKDSLDRFSELLNLKLEEENLQCVERSPGTGAPKSLSLNVETPAATSKLVNASDHQLSSCGDETDTRSQASAESLEVMDKQAGINKSIGCAMALVMIFVAIFAAAMLQKV